MPDSADRNRSVDDRKWAAAANLVKSYNEFQKAVDKYGPFSEQARVALIRTEDALTKFKRMQKIAS